MLEAFFLKNVSYPDNTQSWMLKRALMVVSNMYASRNEMNLPFEKLQSVQARSKRRQAEKDKLFPIDFLDQDLENDVYVLCSAAVTRC